VSLLAVGLVTLAQLTVVAMQAGAAVQSAGVMQQAAREKMEQLRSLAWTSDDEAPVSDRSSDLSTTPVTTTGGTGLDASPPGTLVSNVSGYCDFVDREGRWIAGHVGSPPASAAWIRRWAISPIDQAADTLLLQVVVVSATSGSDAARVVRARGVNGARLIAIRTRSSR
jgi:hypothetical protein